MSVIFDLLMAESRALTLHYDPDCYPDDTLEAFTDFVLDFELWYDDNFPDPPKVFLDPAFLRWKLSRDDQKPSIEE